VDGTFLLCSAKKLMLQTSLKLSASRNLHWTTRSQFSPFQTLTFRLFSKIRVNTGWRKKNVCFLICLRFLSSGLPQKSTFENLVQSTIC